MDALGEVFHFITSGSISGLPPIVLMIIIFVVGLIVGYLIHLFLKIAIIAAIVLFVVAYLGFFGLSLGELKNYATQYGPDRLSVRSPHHRFTALNNWIHNRHNHRLRIKLN